MKEQDFRDRIVIGEMRLARKREKLRSAIARGNTKQVAAIRRQLVSDYISLHNKRTFYILYYGQSAYDWLNG